MYKKYLYSTLISLIIIYLLISIFKISEHFNMHNNMSVWSASSNNLISGYNNEDTNTVKKITYKIPSPPECVCPKCPDCICPTCPSEADIIRKYKYNYPVLNINNPIRNFPQYSAEYRIVGTLHKLHHNQNNQNNYKDKYMILPLFGKEYKGGFFKYYTQFTSGDQLFRKIVSNRLSSVDEISREIYDGDIVEIGSPINAKYKFEEERLDLFADSY